MCSRGRGLSTAGQSSTMWTFSSFLELGTSTLSFGTNIPYLLKLAWEEVSISTTAQDLISSCRAEPESDGQIESVVEAGESHVSWKMNLVIFVGFALVLHSKLGTHIPMKIALTVSRWSRRRMIYRTPITGEEVPCTSSLCSVHDNLLFKTNSRWRWCLTSGMHWEPMVIERQQHGGRKKVKDLSKPSMKKTGGSMNPKKAVAGNKAKSGSTYFIRPAGRRARTRQKLKTFHRHSHWLYIQPQSSSSSSNRFIEHDVSTRKLKATKKYKWICLESLDVYPKKARVSGSKRRVQ